MPSTAVRAVAMNTNATISINNARHLRWCRTPQAKLPIASAIAPLIRTNSARSFARKLNPIKGNTATKSGIARQWIAHATERHAPVVSTHSWLKCLFNFISLENRGRGRYDRNHRPRPTVLKIKFIEKLHVPSGFRHHRFDEG